MKDINRFINKENLSGILLLICALLAMLASNSHFASLYSYFLDISFSVKFNDVGLSKPIFLWINDGLMAVFFLLVGLELKREIISGELKQYDKALLPIAGALGGMVVPALVYIFFAKGHEEVMHAWAIPMATDIAFALGILALLGSRVPLSLKIFMMTLAIIDDLGAIIVIALFHTKRLSITAFLLASICFMILFLFNRFKVGKVSPYIIVGTLMWLCVLKSGFHATISGVLLALCIPMHDKHKKPVLETLEHDLHPMVTFFILPVFAFANAGVPLSGIDVSTLHKPLLLAIIGGLVMGKSIGIFLFTIAAKVLLKIKSSFTNMQLLGVSILCGIGFTMSLFIAGLSFGEQETLLNYSRLGILTGSFISMILGMLVLHYALPKKS